MDDVYTKTNKINEDETNFKKLTGENKENSEVIDASIFDETLTEINQILHNLEQKLEVNQDRLEEFEILPDAKTVMSKFNIAKNELLKKENNPIRNNNLLKRIKDIEKNIKNLNESNLLFNNLEKETASKAGEHEIDKNLLSTEELHAFQENNEKKKKNSIGFYGYLILTIIIFLTFYGILNSFKDLIILKYPYVEAYIIYFYEIIEILKITIFGLFGFIKNII